MSRCGNRVLLLLLLVLLVLLVRLLQLLLQLVVQLLLLLLLCGRQVCAAADCWDVDVRLAADTPAAHTPKGSSRYKEEVQHAFKPHAD